MERKRNGLAPVAPDPYDILFITDRTQKPMALRTTITIDTRLRTNFGVFLSQPHNKGARSKETPQFFGPMGRLKLVGKVVQN